MTRTRLVARNVLSTIATQLLSWALTFSVTLYLPSYVGDSGMGKLAFANSFVTIFGVFASLGISTVLVREIAREQQRIKDLLPGALCLHLLLGIMLSVAALLTSKFVGHPEITQLLIAINAGAMVIYTANTALSAALQGLENIPRQSIGILVDKFFASTATIALIFLKAPIWVIASVNIFAAAASFLINFGAFRPWMSKFCIPKFDTVQFLIFAGMPFFAMHVFRTLYNQIDITLLHFLTNDATVGWYAVSGRLLGSTLFIPVAIASALLPTLTKLFHENEAKFLRIVQRALLLVILFAIPIGLPIFFCARTILLDILRYPESFANATVVLSLYGLGCIFWYLTQIMGTALVAMERQHQMSRISFTALILTITGCVVAIPLFHRFFGNGAIGAAIVNVTVEVYMVTAFFRCLPRGIVDRNFLLRVIKAAVAICPLSAFLAYSKGNLTLVILGVIIGLLIYAILGFRWGCIDDEDIAMFKRALNKNQSQ